MKMKKFLAIALACVMALSLVACGGSPASSSMASDSQVSSGTATGEPTTLQVYTWWDITQFEHLQKMQADFEERQTLTSNWNSSQFRPAIMQIR